MSIFKIIILALVQGMAELLPVSSSAHVVVAEKLMGLDASSPQMTLMLVMLHTGTMFAVIVYFWNQWKRTYFSSGDAFKRFLIRLIWASLLTKRTISSIWSLEKSLYFFEFVSGFPWGAFDCNLSLVGNVLGDTWPSATCPRVSDWVDIV